MSQPKNFPISHRKMKIGCGCNCCALEGQLPCSEGCCKCPGTGDLSFDILDCQAYYLAENPIDGIDNWYPIDSCCTGMTFGLTKKLGYEICSRTGHVPSTTDEAGNTCLTTGTGVGQPTGTGSDVLTELWGFKGTTCNGCTSIAPREGPDANPLTGWHEPHFASETCDGMCLMASLCCCQSPTSGASIGGGARCGGGADLPGRKKSCRCSVTCYKFTMEPWDCHEIANSVICPPQTGTFMSACSACSFLQTPVVTGVIGDLPPLPSYTGCTSWDCNTYPNQTGSSMGAWDVWAGCLPDVARGPRECGVIPHTGSATCSGQCPNTGVGGGFTRNMMLLVDGVYRSQCDCATGQFELMCGGDLYTPSGVGKMNNVFVKFTGLISSA